MNKQIQDLKEQIEQQKQRFYKAEKMFEEGTQEFHDKHYKDICKVLDNIAELEKKIRNI